MAQQEVKLQACTSLIEEHRAVEKLLDALEAELISLPGETTLSERESSHLYPLLRHIEQEMDVHFACEEQVLFPAVNPYHPMVLMEVEHEEILLLRSQLQKLANERALGQAIREVGLKFIEELRDHIAREDGGIFPVSEQALSEAEKRQVIEGMDELRARAKQEVIPAIIRQEKRVKNFRMNLQEPPTRALNIALLAELGGTQIKHLTIQAGQSLASHWTPKQLLVVCVAGKGHLKIDEEETLLSPGVGALLSPQQLHAVYAAEQEDCHLLLIFQGENASSSP